LTDPWSLLAPILAGYVAIAGAIVGFLIREIGTARKAVADMTDKMITQVIPALERSTAAGQAVIPVLDRDAAAMGAMVEATGRLLDTTNELQKLLAVLSDRQARTPPTRPRRAE
jgi:hypothetical protein